jgi:cellobiose-specific phosphotransferase system component IIB
MKDMGKRSLILPPSLLLTTHPDLTATESEKWIHLPELKHPDTIDHPKADKREALDVTRPHEDDRFGVFYAKKNARDAEAEPVMVIPENDFGEFHGKATIEAREAEAIRPHQDDRFGVFYAKKNARDSEAAPVMIIPENDFGEFHGKAGIEARAAAAQTGHPHVGAAIVCKPVPNNDFGVFHGKPVTTREAEAEAKRPHEDDRFGVFYAKIAVDPATPIMGKAA